MFKTLWRGTIVTTLLAFTVLLGGMLAGGTTATAQGLDPESVVVAFAEALNEGQSEAAISLFAEDAFFSDIDGGSFAAVGHPAVSFILQDVDVESDPDFHVEILEISAAGDTVTGVAEVTDAIAVAAGVDRYIQPFTFVVVDGKISEAHFTYDTSDAQTQTFLDFTASQEEDGEFPGASVELTLEGTQPGGGFVGDAVSLGATANGISAVGVFLEPGSGLQTANIYEGTCDALGDVASRLAVLSQGIAFSIVSLEYAHLTTEPHAIAVQASETDATIVACGEIEAAATPPLLPSTGMGAGSTDGTPFGSLATALAALGAVAVVTTGAARATRRS